MEGPPGGWEATLEGREFRSPAFVECAQLVHAFAASNKIQVDASALVHQCTASRLIRDGHAALCVSTSPVSRSLAQYWDGLKGYVEIESRVWNGIPIFVTQEEANKRAAVCSKCSLCSLPSSRSMAARASNEILAKRTDGRTTPHDDQIDTCDVCSCFLPTIVHLAGDLLFGKDDANKYPLNCWRHPDYAKS